MANLEFLDSMADAIDRDLEGGSPGDIFYSFSHAVPFHFYARENPRRPGDLVLTKRLWYLRGITDAETEELLDLVVPPRLK